MGSVIGDNRIPFLQAYGLNNLIHLQIKSKFEGKKCKQMNSKTISICGLLIQEDQILVCGGTSDQGYDSRTCITFTLGSQHWVAFNNTMDRPRIHSHAKINDGKVFIIGGIDSHPLKNCRESEEILNLQNPDEGWQLESLPSGMDNVCFLSEVILEIPCIWMNSSSFLYNENKQFMHVGTCIQCLRDYRSYLLVLVGAVRHQDQSCRQNTEVFGFIAKGS